MGLVTHQVSPQQARANRTNARKSTGPVTEGGKHNVAVAALRHGLYSGDTLGIVIAALGEKQEDYNALRQGLTDYWQPANAQEEVLVQNLTRQSWIQNRALRAQGHAIQAELENVEKQLRQQALAMEREVLDEKDSRIQQWGVRRLDDSPAKFRYWIEVLQEASQVAKAGLWQEPFEEAYAPIYGQHPSLHEELIVSNARELTRERLPDEPPVEAGLVSETLAMLYQDLEEVEREYELYQQRQARLAEAQRGVCLAPNSPQFLVAQRKSESAWRQIRQIIDMLLKLRRQERAGGVSPAQGSAATGSDEWGPNVGSVNDAATPSVNGSQTEASNPEAAAAASQPKNREAARSRGSAPLSNPAIPKASTEAGPGPVASENKDESHYVVENKGSALAEGAHGRTDSPTPPPARPRLQGRCAPDSEAQVLESEGQLDIELPVE